MKAICTILLTVFTVWRCEGQFSSFLPVKGKGVHTATNIRAIYEDKKGNYWLGSDGEGLYRYDGKTLTLFTRADGLCDNQIRDIQEDKQGNIWLVTGGDICSFNGVAFSKMSGNVNHRSEWRQGAGSIWFPAFKEKGVYRYDGAVVHYYDFLRQESNVSYDEYAVYCIYTDRSGNVWFGTQNKGVCKFDGKKLTWLTEKGLDGAAVRSIFQDKAGNMWFGNNGYGLFKYDGKTLSNVTDEKGLGNPDFIKHLNGKEGTMARVWAIDEDSKGNLWIATIDAGLWFYNGKKLTNYTTKHGLPANSVTAVYKDRKGMMWFGTAGEICQFDGKRFVRVKF